MLKPQPTKNAAADSHPSPARPLRAWTARSVAHPASTIHSTSSVSGLLSRLIATVMGVSASTSALSSPATGPNARRAVACTTPTAAVPARACGSSMLHVPNPSTRPDSAISHSAIGGLSTVMNEPASSDPKKNAFQSCVPACTAAA